MSSEYSNLAREMSLGMNKYQNMKAFIAPAAEYIKHPSEATASVLQMNLNTLSTTQDSSIYDPGTLITAEFYSTLYNLTNILSTHTPMIWNVIDVLQHACKNSAARHTLIHTYNFAPILSRLLETNLTSEKRSRVLKLLQELTYGVKIHSQEAHLPRLISTLTQWIVQSKDEEIVTLSLGVLINICYKNLPAVHILMKTGNTKALHKMLLTLNSSNVHTRLQCCKLLIIMEKLSKDIPDKFILEFVMVTFHSLVAAIEYNDVLLLRDIVEFFDDVRQDEHSKVVLVSYQNYVENIDNILQQLEESSNAECIALVMEFLLCLVKLKIPSLISLYPVFIKVAMQQVPIEKASLQAISLIKTVLIDSRRTKSSAEVISELNLSTLMLVINTNTNEDDDMDGKNEKRNIEMNKRLIELFQLLLEMSKIPNFRAQITEAFSEQTMRRLLKPMLQQDDLISSDNWPGNFVGDTITALYIYALTLSADLAIQNSNWLTLYSELIRRKQIQMMIALALWTGDSELKQKCFQLMASDVFPQECITAVSRCMCDVQPLILIQNSTGITTDVSVKSDSFSNIDMTPLFSIAQQERLDATLQKLNCLLEEGKISNTKTSAVMELYEFKVAAMRHAERSIQGALEAANAFATSLQHRLAQVMAESNRLYQLLFHTQQNCEVIQEDKTRINVELQEAIEKSKRIHATQKQEIQGLKKIVSEKSATIEQLSKLKKEFDAAMSMIENLESKIENLEKEKKNCETKVKDVIAKNHELGKSLNKKEQIIETQKKELKAGQEGMSALTLENEQLIRQCQSYERTIAEKEETVQRLNNELADFNRMRDMIYHLTAKKRDDQNETT